jgi:hypothetical protein
MKQPRVPESEDLAGTRADKSAQARPFVNKNSTIQDAEASGMVERRPEAGSTRSLT